MPIILWTIGESVSSQIRVILSFQFDTAHVFINMLTAFINGELLKVKKYAGGCNFQSWESWKRIITFAIEIIRA